MYLVFFFLFFIGCDLINQLLHNNIQFSLSKHIVHPYWFIPNPMNVKCDIIDYWLVEMWLLVVQPWTGTRLNISYWRPKHRHSLKQSSMEKLQWHQKAEKVSMVTVAPLSFISLLLKLGKNGLVKCVMMLDCVLFIEKDVLLEIILSHVLFFLLACVFSPFFVFLVE